MCYSCWSWSVFLPDINECQLGTDLCVNAECDNTAGSYTCTCLPGFIPQNLTTCSKFCLHMLGTMSLEFALHEMILSTCFVYISQIAQMVTSGWWMAQSHQWGRAEWKSVTIILMAASVMTSGTLLMQVWCADSWDWTDHKVLHSINYFLV